ncbi:hypothetical protein V2W55_20070, partial [Acinetobacter baumannii]
FGALAAALLAERMGWPGTPPAAILACQHKFYARQVLQQVAPEANVAFELLQAAYGDPVPEGLHYLETVNGMTWLAYGDPVPEGLHYPLFVKPIKA